MQTVESMDGQTYIRMEQSKATLGTMVNPSAQTATMATILEESKLTQVTRFGGGGGDGNNHDDTTWICSNCTLINLKTDDNYNACSAAAPGGNLMLLVEDNEKIVMPTILMIPRVCFK